MKYKAKVIIVNDIAPHPNADNLNILKYGGVQFVVSKSLKEGDVVVLFPEDGQLSEEFCKENNLYRDASKNRNPLKSGFFEDSRRVRAQPFRGQKSYGFVAGVSYFDYLGKVSLSVGDEFDTLNGKPVCQKYYTPKTLLAMSRNTQKKVKDVQYTMQEHTETDKWSYTRPTTIPLSLVVISEKAHGTSARTSKTKVVYRNPYFWQKIVSSITKRDFVVERYEPVTGTRRTVVNNRLDITTEGQQDHYRWEWHNKIAPQLHVGETIYYEIVGWDSGGGTIMERQDLSKLKKTEFINPEWKNPMVYSYGLPEGQTDVYVYRITITSDDGTVTELPWFAVESRVKELGLKTVPVLEVFLTEDVSVVQAAVDSYMTNNSSTLDNRHLMEGICVRFENIDGMKVYKEKNYAFGVLEGYLKEKEDYIDTEESN